MKKYKAPVSFIFYHFTVKKQKNLLNSMVFCLKVLISNITFIDIEHVAPSDITKRNELTNP